jgi:hypothetical protein
MPASPWRAECPTCHTSYTFGRIGISEGRAAAQHTTVGCVVCGTAFDCDVTPTRPWSRLWMRDVQITTTPRP